MRAKCTAALLAVILASPASAMGWNVSRSNDPFTDKDSCRVDFGTSMSRGIVEGLLNWYGVSYFFVEQRGDELIAGITNDRKLPIAGDIQIRVDDGPVTTITPSDTPDDYLPPSHVVIPTTGNPDTDKQIAQTMRSAQAQMLPFRVTSGEKARALLRSILGGQKAIWRSVSLISSGDDRPPSEIRIEGLRTAVDECGINLEQKAPAPVNQ